MATYQLQYRFRGDTWWANYNGFCTCKLVAFFTYHELCDEFPGNDQRILEAETGEILAQRLQLL